MTWTHRERFFAAIEHREPDMVPVADLAIDPPLVERITGIPTSGISVTGGATGTDLWEASKRNLLADIAAHRKLGLDAIVFHYGSFKPRKFTPRMLRPNVYVDEWGKIMEERKDTGVAWSVDGTVKTPDDLENYVPPSPESPGVMELIRFAVKESRADGMVVGGLTHAGLQMCSMIRGGIAELIKDMYMNPGFAKKFLAKVADALVEWCKFLIDAGIDVVVLADDYCDSHGPMISPKLFREFELPNLKRSVDTAKRKGVPVLKHTDGNAYPILGDMIDAGIAGLNPIEPGAMDLGHVKQTYGQRIFLMGNVDCRYVLPNGSEEDVRRDVRRCIDSASYGGGHVLSSSNSLHANCRVENVLTMVDEARKYGKYPLRRAETRDPKAS